MFRRIAAVVSATAGVLAVVALSLLFSSSAQISFAEVMDKVAKTQSVTCKQTVTIPGKPAETVRMAILANGLSRMDMPDGNYTIMDMKTGNAVTTEGLANLSAPPKDTNLLAPEVMPGVGLGAVKFGMSREEVIKILGKPDAEGKTNIDYPSRGYGFVVSPKKGVMAISCFSQQMMAFKIRDFAGKTKEGIGIGSSQKDLENAFGKPDSIENYGPEGAHAASIRYSKLGLEMTLWSGKVVTFMMQAPHRQPPSP